MLLRHTSADVMERSALTINPAKTCQPIGAMYAALGVHNCLPHSHGSQGCCAYHRSALTKHYKEPVMAGTSSFTEGSAVFGGQANLLQAITNMFALYNPDIIAIHTTCLSETIGDDIVQIVAKAREEGKVPPGKHLIHANTPSYVGSHVTGFSNMVKGIVKYLSEATGRKRNQVNLIPGWVEPSDMRELRRICRTMGINPNIFPDTSDVLDAPLTGQHEFYPRGGAPVEEIRHSGDSRSTLALGPTASEAAALALEEKCEVRAEVLELPIGLLATDRFINALRHRSGIRVPGFITDERGRLVDMIADMHQYFYRKRVALFGDPDQLVSLAEFLVTMDMRPVYIVTGTPGKRSKPESARQLAIPFPKLKSARGPRPTCSFCINGSRRKAWTC